MKDIEKLLKRFMDGETSVEEETALTDFFRSATDEDRPANISGEDWETYRTMFRQFEEWETGEQESQMHIAETVNGQVAHAHGNKVAWLSAAAAVAAIFVLAFLLNVGRNNRQVVAELTLSGKVAAKMTHPLIPRKRQNHKGNANYHTPLPFQGDLLHRLHKPTGLARTACEWLLKKLNV